MPSIAALECGEYVERACFLGDQAAFALADGTLQLFDGNDRGEHQRLELHKGGLLVARRDPFAQRLLSGGEDGRVVSVDACGTVAEIASLGSKWVSVVAGGPQGAVAAASGRTVVVWQPGSGPREVDVGRTAEDVAFAPKGMRVAVARYDGISLAFPATNAEPQFLEWKGAHLGASFSPDGRFVVTTMQENALHGWRIADGKHMRMTGYPGKVKDWSWSAKGKFLATSGAPAAILWPFSGKDGPMGKAPLELGTRGNSMVSSVACHPVEDMIAIGFQDGMILAVRFSDAKEALLRAEGTGPVRTMGWDAGGRRLAFGSENGEAGIIDLTG